MARQKNPDPPADDIPSWVMTFSDVITLLMTFFILLLTFASNEPETFERMQVSLFGGGGAVGIAGDSTSTMDLDAMLVRKRPRSGRITSRGSEMPPVYTDPEYESVARGIAGLEKGEDRALSTTHALDMQLSLLLDSDDNLTTVGRQRMHMIGVQMRKRPLRLDLLVGDETALDRAITLAEWFTREEGVALGDVGVGVGVAPWEVAASTLRLVLTEPQ